MLKRNFPFWQQLPSQGAPLSLTSLSIVADCVEIQEMGSDQSVVHGIHILKLDLDPLAKWRKHLRKDNLLVPVGRIAALLYRCPALKSRGRR